MRIRRIAAHELDAGLIARWNELRRENAVFEGPFFDPEFTRRVASVKANVEIAVVESDGGVAAFWPYERVSPRVAGPVGGALSDYHGAVSAAGGVAGLNPADLLRACGLRAWDFTHLPQGQSVIPSQGAAVGRSLQIDISSGYPAYIAGRRAAGSQLAPRVAHLERRLARDVGPLRFVAEETEDAVFDALLKWKSAQYVRTRNPDLFGSGPSRAVLEAIRAARTPGFGATLSALYAGDRLVAAHFGMKSPSQAHYWFPAYDIGCSRFSPGLILLLNMVRAGAEAGLDKIDLGAGEETYKLRFATGAAPLRAGSFELANWINLSRALRRHLIARLRGTPLAGLGRRLRSLGA